MSNIQRIQKALENTGLDGLLLYSPVNRQYATGFHSSDGGLLVTPEKAWFFTDSRYMEAAELAVCDAELRLVSGAADLLLKLAELVSGLGLQTLGAEESRLSHALWGQMADKLPAALVPADEVMNTLRASKSKEELDVMIRAQRIAERALDDVLGIIRPGLTEREIAAEITYRMMKYGGDGNGFDPIVVTGAKSSMPHGVPGDVEIKRGDFLTMDFGTIYRGYCSDMTRTVAVGSADDEMRRVYDVVLEAQLAGIAAARPGALGCDIHEAAAKVIGDAGYGDYFTHGFGHGLGMEVHEELSASPRGKTPLPEGGVISAEPGIYLPGRFGVRIEDAIFLTGDGCVNLMKAPKELLIV